MNTGLAGKVAVVTGATANVGRGIALAFAAEGAGVVVVGRDEASGERVVRRALDRGAAAAFWRPTDVTDHNDVVALVTDVLERFGRIDVLVNGVGGNADVMPFVDSNPDEWLRDIEVNLLSTLAMTHAVLPHLLAQGSGCVINIGSTAGLIGDRSMAVYSAAKGGVHAFTKVLALEVGRSGVTVNAIAPYRTRSDDPAEAAEGVSASSRYHPERGLFARLATERPDVIGSMLRETALVRDRARPEEIGAAAVYLASEQAAFVTGQVLVIDGGVSVV
ncbi:SDR family NAD(P)-dependent oxidoreductase [Nonomuraea sp. NPDC005650]|uniref:SDR family NAD(P)-dependent oxidoreductase n=1 Tax=Nonomuraea sp. NPDC005650 TaxID=3157045 RepID=UPI0033B28796